MTDEVCLLNQMNNPALTGCAQNLRRNMTKEERHLWFDFLKHLPVPFRRQKVIGNYIVDFYCAQAKLVIELDGSQHYMDEGKEADGKRDAALSGIGLTVLRYSNLEVNQNFEGVCADIMRHIDTSSASLRSAPSPQGEGL